MAGLGGLDEDFVEVEGGEGPSENIHVDPGTPKQAPRWRQIEMMRERRQLDDLLDSYEDLAFDDSEEE